MKPNDAMKALSDQIKISMKSDHAPGKQEVSQVLTNHRSKPKPKPTKISKPKSRKRVSQGKAQKVSVSLHPEDLAGIETIKTELRNLGIRNVSDSMALKAAIERFQNAEITLAEIKDRIKSRDKRAKPENP